MTLTPEQKDLLLKDLCARLPYGVKYLKYSWDYDRDQEIPEIEVLECIDKNGYINHRRVYTITDIKPFLFPLESMNEVQKHIYSIYINELKQSNGIYFEKALNSLQFWLYANHFDVNNLIPMGLANNAVGLNIY